MPQTSQLEHCLAKQYARARRAAAQAVNTNETEVKAAYARGIKDALELVTRHLSRDPEPEKTSESSPLPDRVPLCQMSPQAVAALDLKNGVEKQAVPYTLGELIEAAFTFENQLLAALGDDNTMPYETYADLTREALVDIIQKSADDICRLSTG